MFGLGNAQTKCTRSYNVAPHPQASHWNAMYAPKLVWISPKTVTLLMPDGTENRFNAEKRKKDHQIWKFRHFRPNFPQKTKHIGIGIVMKDAP
jgi:hypothetical protein